MSFSGELEEDVEVGDELSAEESGLFVELAKKDWAVPLDAEPLNEPESTESMLQVHSMLVSEKIRRYSRVDQVIE